MSNRGETWVHGNAVVIQYPGGDGEEFTNRRRMKKVTDPTTGATVPWSDLLGLRMGPNAIFRGQAGNSNWFHFSIPTPAIFPRLDVPQHLEITVDRVSVYFKTPNNQIVIQTVVVTDGEITRSVPDVTISRNLHGDHTTDFVEGVNSFLIDPIPIRLGTAHGVLISVEARFDVEGDITFKGAAIHYSVG